MLKIKLFSGEKIVATANNIKLEPYSTSFLRTFHFDEVEMKPAGELDCFELLIAKVYNLNRKNKYNLYSYIEMYINRIINPIETKSFTVEVDVIISQYYSTPYRQGVIDVYNHWKKNEELECTQLPKNISIMDYISACFYYSSLSEITPEKSKIEIDFKYITDESEIVCCFAEDFMGKRSYIGRDFHGFKDCLHILSDYRNKDFEDKYVILKYKNLFLDDEMKKNIDKFQNILNMYKFNIIVE